MYAKQTPWGTSQSHTSVADGIEFHSTASHGGYWLSDERKAMMKAKGLPVKNWYEEDCEWAYVCRAFPDVFPQEAHEHANRMINWLTTKR